MNVSARTLRANLWWSASKSCQLLASTSLRTFLVGQAVAARALIAAGTIKTNIANGHTTEFDSAGMTAREVVDMWVYLVEEFDRAATELAAVTTGAADLTIMAQMEANLRPVVNATNNWMFLQK